MANQAALNLFNATFPNGAFHAQVSGSGLLCGLRAIRASIIHQHPYIDPPKSQTLLEVFYSDRIQGPNQALGAEAMVNTNNFYVDQLGAVLYHWGMTQGYNLRLWYIVDDGQCYLVGTPGGEEEIVRTVWIATTSRDGVSGGVGFDHYTGLIPGDDEDGEGGEADGLLARGRYH